MPSLRPLRGLALLFFVELPPPPGTPFPYTTLFRSAAARRDDRLRGNQAVKIIGTGLQSHEDNLRDWRPVPMIFTADRKSTRLNSSHGSISYAVFCLKKKKS